MKASHRAALLILVVVSACDGEGTGPNLPAGSQAGLSEYEIVTKPVNVSATNRLTESIKCPAGKYVLGGGMHPRTIGLTAVNERAVMIMGSAPTQDQQGWRVDAMINSTGIVAELYAVCARLQF